MKKLLKIGVLAVLLATLLTSVASASSAYATYTYSSSGFVLESPDAYSVDTIVDSAYMGVDVLKPTDIEVDSDGNVYIVDSDAASVHVLDRYYKHQYSISHFNNEQGVADTFANPQGVFVNDKYVYVCDTDNGRIVMFKRGSDEFVKTVAQPVSNLFEEDAIYKPVAVAVDE